MLKNKKTVTALLLIPQYLIVKLLATYPDFIENYYSKGIYLYISKVFRYALGWLPFAFGDIIYLLSIVYILRWFYNNRKWLIKDPKNWLIDITSAISIMYFAFHLFWGLNYYRNPLHKNLNLNHEYTTEQLVSVTKKLIAKTNTLHSKLSKNDTLKIDIPYTKQEVLKLAPEGYKNLKTIFPNLEYQPKSVKISLFSYPLTYMGFSGYLNPFTNEAQVNGLIPIYKIPTTTAHEIAHQLGYAAENEANFIGALAAINHNDIYFNYSGYAFILRYCLNELYNRDDCIYEDLVADVNKGVLNNYKKVRNFWDAHENPAEPIFKMAYSNYL